MCRDMYRDFRYVYEVVGHFGMCIDIGYVYEVIGMCMHTVLVLIIMYKAIQCSEV